MVHRTRQQRTAKRPVRIKTVLAQMLMVIAIASSSLGWIPAIAARADGLDGDTYSSEEDGWSVEFDERIWEAEEIDERTSKGVLLVNDAMIAVITVRNDGIEDSEECFEDLEERTSDSDTTGDLRPTRRLDPPGTDRRAVGGLFTGTFAAEDGEVDVVIYLECREVDRATLTVFVLTADVLFESSVPDIEELLDGIDTSDRQVTTGKVDESDDGGTTTTISGSSGSSPSKRVSLDAGQYRVSVRGTASGDFGGLFSVTIEGSGYYELPINDVIEASGPYSSSSEVFIESSGSATISVTTLGLDNWTLTLTPVGSSGSSDDSENDADAESGSGGQDAIRITGTNGSSPSKRVNLDAGQYRVKVSGNAPEGFGGLFSVTIEGSDYYELPINEVIQRSGPYSASSEVYIESSGSATISVTTLGLDDWTLTLTLVDPA